MNTFMVAFLYISFVAFSLPKSYSTILRLIEGEEAKLHFQYPCSSTDVTLRHGYKPSFYSLAHPDAQAIPERLLIQNSTDGDICLICLTITPVKRTDVGTYILTVYKDGQLLDEHTVRIGLRIVYPPGKASCELSEEYVTEDWVSIHCTAPVGTLQGQIECYQQGFRTPPVAQAVQTDKTMEQKFWAMKHSYPIFCCTSITNQHRDMCKCQDFIYHPFNETKANITLEPCPLTTTQDSPPAQCPTNEFANVSLASINRTMTSAVPQLPGNTNFNILNVILLTTVCIEAFLLIIETLVIVYLVHRLKRKRENNTATPDKDNEMANLRKQDTEEQSC